MYDYKIKKMISKFISLQYTLKTGILICLFTILLFICVQINNLLSKGIHSTTILPLKLLYAFNKPGLCQDTKKYYKPVLNKLDENVNYKKLELHPNLPHFLYNNTNSSVLSSIPDIPSIRWAGVVWQESWEEKPKFYLYSAHFDSRHYSASYIRVIALYSGNVPPETDLYSCQLWYNEKKPPIIVPTNRFDLLDYQKFSRNYLIPYVISCQIPSVDDVTGYKDRDPIAVSIVKNACNAPYNILQVIPERKDEEKFTKNDTDVTVCGPALYYYNEDFSVRLVEWIEIQRSAGVSFVLLYTATNHPNVEKVLQYYSDQGFVKVVPFRYPPPYVDLPDVRRAWVSTKRNAMYALENIYFTDCVLRARQWTPYAMHLDPDEIIINAEGLSMPDLIAKLRTAAGSGNTASYFLKWRVFYPDAPQSSAVAIVPKKFHILRHIYTLKSGSIKNVDDNGKSIYDLSEVLGVYSHKALLYSNIKAFSFLHRKVFRVAISMAYVAHFRKGKCGRACDSKEKSFKETQLLRNQTDRVSQIMDVLRQIGLNYLV